MQSCMRPKLDLTCPAQQPPCPGTLDARHAGCDRGQSAVAQGPCALEAEGDGDQGIVCAQCPVSTRIGAPYGEGRVVHSGRHARGPLGARHAGRERGQGAVAQGPCAREAEVGGKQGGGAAAVDAADGLDGLCGEAAHRPRSDRREGASPRTHVCEAEQCQHWLLSTLLATYTCLLVQDRSAVSAHQRTYKMKC